MKIIDLDESPSCNDLLSQFGTLSKRVMVLSYGQAAAPVILSSIGKAERLRLIY